MAKQALSTEAPAKPHVFTLENRKKLNLTGIRDVSAFDENQISLLTESGQLTIDGEALHVTALQLAEGHVAIEGKINAMIYSGSEKGRKKLPGLFR